MEEFKPPLYASIQSCPTIFLAGSIEQGVADRWQARIADRFKDYNVSFFNPRRDNWDPTWVQDPSIGTQFTEQVTWELDHILDVDLVVFYFDPNTTSPITLLELGLCLGMGRNILVCCPDGYYRKGNVVLTCMYTHCVPVINTLDELIETIEQYLTKI